MKSNSTICHRSFNWNPFLDTRQDISAFKNETIILSARHFRKKGGKKEKQFILTKACEKQKSSVLGIIKQKCGSAAARGGILMGISTAVSFTAVQL